MKEMAASPRAQFPSPRLRWRLLKDRAARYGFAVGGVSTIVFVVAIAFYLVWVVLPLFRPAGAEPAAAFGADGAAAALVADEYGETAARHLPDGRVEFLRLADGARLGGASPLPLGARATAYGRAEPSTGVFAYGLDDGRAVVLKQAFRVSYPQDRRVVTPALERPLGEEPLVLDEEGAAVVRIAVQDAEDEATVAGLLDDGRVVLVHFAKSVSLLDESVSLERSASEVPAPGHPVDYLLLDRRQQALYLAARDGRLSHYDVRDKSAPRLVERLRLVPEGRELTALAFLNGDYSLLAGDSGGTVRQWTLVRVGGEQRLRAIRLFEAFDAPVVAIAPEQARKGFAAAAADGTVGVFHSTAHRTLLRRAADPPPRLLAFAPRADWLLLEGGGRLALWRVRNEHPEVSWQALWGRVWYEGYDRPMWIWQSSAATDDFEPKYSLTPLAFGTLKAAFYAMLLAVPLSILGAIYTAQFMAPRMRQAVKPVIEIMEALPTVVLGFLAGLWLAPYVEKHLPGLLAVALALPPALLLAAWLWRHTPLSLRRWVPDGWEAALLLPWVAAVTWAGVAASGPLEDWLFGGDMRLWLTKEMGIPFDQRNAIVVGLAMGFAVIPTIFSIAEDAIFGVPRHLIHGSLALGATPWQTLVRVVLLTASPGIFSAIMIGLGRAVGETMIVLMATGNTPVMDFSPFQGFRTLSANIAVELPESEVGSTHYRVLFLGGLVLFVATFVLNTAAEMVRQRLRRRYSSL